MATDTRTSWSCSAAEARTCVISYRQHNDEMLRNFNTATHPLFQQVLVGHLLRALSSVVQRTAARAQQ
jgi:hypothetical protein